MVLKFSSGGKRFDSHSRRAVFVSVGESAREVNVLHVFPQVAPIVASLTTKGASVGLQSSLWSPHNILV